jgi:hypothetical protein
MVSSSCAKIRLGKGAMQLIVKPLILDNDAYVVTPFLPVPAIKIKLEFCQPVRVDNVSFGKGQISWPGC